MSEKMSDADIERAIHLIDDAKARGDIKPSPYTFTGRFNVVSKISKVPILVAEFDLSCLILEMQEEILREFAFVRIMERRGITSFSHTMFLEHRETPENKAEVVNILKSPELMDRARRMMDPFIPRALTYVAQHIPEKIADAALSLVKEASVARTKAAFEEHGKQYFRSRQLEKLGSDELRAMKARLGVKEEGGRPLNTRNQPQSEDEKKAELKEILEAMHHVCDVEGAAHPLQATAKRMGVSKITVKRRLAKWGYFFEEILTRKKRKEILRRLPQG